MVDKIEAAVWLAGHGFETEDGSNFTAPIPGGKFEIELSERWARSVLTSGDRRVESHKTSYRSLELNRETDTLHGIGLYTLFGAETFDGGEPPVWFSRPMIDALAAKSAQVGASAGRTIH